jgi:hypothetical protein
MSAADAGVAASISRIASVRFIFCLSARVDLSKATPGKPPLQLGPRHETGFLESEKLAGNSTERT